MPGIQEVKFVFEHQSTANEMGWVCDITFKWWVLLTRRVLHVKWYVNLTLVMAENLTTCTVPMVCQLVSNLLCQKVWLDPRCTCTEPQDPPQDGK